MTRFIGATQASANPKYYAMDEISDLMCGRNIRMIGGVLDGYEGKLQTIRGSKTKHLIIILPSLLAVSVEITTSISSCCNRPTYSLFVLVLFLKLLS